MVKIILVIVLLTTPTLSIAWGGPEFVKIDYIQYDEYRKPIKKLGEILCERNDIRVEIIESNRTNYKDVVIACKPKIFPLSIYHLSNKRAYELAEKMTGFKSCMTEDGINKCPAKE